MITWTSAKFRVGCVWVGSDDAYEELDSPYVLIRDGDHHVCLVPGDEPDIVRTILAAPRLQEAARQMLQHLDPFEWKGCPVYEEFKAAIGENP